jgi:hypothetical protein
MKVFLVLLAISVMTSSCTKTYSATELLVGEIFIRFPQAAAASESVVTDTAAQAVTGGSSSFYEDVCSLMFGRARGTQGGYKAHLQSFLFSGEIYLQIHGTWMENATISFDCNEGEHLRAFENYSTRYPLLPSYNMILN